MSGLAEAFAELATPLLADACVRLGLPLRLAPQGIAPIVPGMMLAGRARPVRHYGSVDVFLEAVAEAELAGARGEVLVIDNGGRLDEGCIGDLTVLEARAAGLAGLVVWGGHRDTRELREIGHPVFSYGAQAAGPLRTDEREVEALGSARFGAELVTAEDAVFADDDGVLFVPLARVDDCLACAREIHETERRQADALARGLSLRQQLDFDAFLERRGRDPGHSFRAHLRERGGAIEE